ncbi:hypothetical protein STCU_01621 [Strigomonas culicis]|uniref:Uncharacterized protein n=1 Tax=Strigomonas culicis TaxID=28005 RepID=S9WF57_9TRYP|nr:hypothetical protein STCU_01621 [Strigomonas culicis]|eukprot:EPY34365.1 hypothetical protein STCU_01621 [Strigomonas culicis]
MSSLLVSGGGSGVHGHVYAPIPLNHRDAAQAAAAASRGMQGPGGSGVAVQPKPRPATAPATGEDQDRGVAFLKEGVREEARAWEANRRFHEQILRPCTLTASPLGDPRADASGGGDLVWLQMPRFYENAPFDLATMDPGKVGELVVLKSGRMLLRIHNVYYDVAASCEAEPTAEGDTPTPAPSGSEALEGPCSMAVISNSTASTHVLSGERPTVSCCEVGLLTKKLICTPTIVEHS